MICIMQFLQFKKHILQKKIYNDRLEKILKSDLIIIDKIIER